MAAPAPGILLANFRFVCVTEIRVDTGVPVRVGPTQRWYPWLDVGFTGVVIGEQSEMPAPQVEMGWRCALHRLGDLRDVSAETQ
jgi:hypothetical protein